MIKTLVVLLLIVWIFAFFGTMDIVLWVTGATGALICMLGIAMSLVLWKVISRIEKLEKKAKDVPIPNF